MNNHLRSIGSPLQSVMRVLLLPLVMIGFGICLSAQSTVDRLDPQQHRIVTSIETMFHAVAANDAALLHSVAEPEFYLFDAGTRFDAQSIMELLQQMKASGTHFEWNVTEPDVHVLGDTAWVAYVDHGSITDDKGTRDMKWLESAFLVRHGDQWKLAFMQSTPVVKPDSPK